MNRRRMLLGIGALIVAVGLVPGAPSTPARAEAATQTGQAGAVTIKATWQGPSAGRVFTVVLDTHAVNLDQYDLSQLAVLRTDQGDEAVPMSWDAPAGGHHRQGTLSFASTKVDDSPLITPETRVLRLSIRDIGGSPETVLEWALAQ